MAFMSKVGNLLKQSVGTNINSASSASSNPSILQAIRCMSSSKFIPRFFSSNRNNNGDDFTNDSWKFPPDNDDQANSIFGEDGGDLSGLADEPFKAPVGRSQVNVDSWGKDTGDIFGGTDKEFESSKSAVGGGDDEWKTAEGYKPWNLEEEKSGVFDIGEEIEAIPDEVSETEKREADHRLDQEVKDLSVQLKGPSRAFGDLIAASGITDAMLDSLIALKDLEAVEGLPPLSEIEDMRLAKNETKNTRADLERQKQEEIAKSRVRRVDDKGRAYGTGRRKCSVARVFIQPGEGNFVVNDKQFDVYFPILDHRADLLRPFSETKTLGLWDVNCTVKGGGVSGQVGAIRLGISRALQNWEPGLRPNLRAAGFLTRDPRMVERKKPGKAKARKSFQWVKR